jgi:hypothetical protein
MVLLRKVLEEDGQVLSTSKFEIGSLEVSYRPGIVGAFSTWMAKRARILIRELALNLLLMASCWA